MPDRPTAPARGALIALAIALWLAAGTPATPAALAAAGPASASDPRDTQGPLDLTAATLTQRDIRMVLRLETAGGWNSADLTSTPGRALCVTLLRGDPAAAHGRVCVTRRAARTALNYTPLNADGTPSGSPRRLAARTSRPTATTLEATFLPAAADMAVGPYAWSAESAWTEDGACAQSCLDRVPDGGEIAADIELLAVPPCFGAAARDPAAPCQNPDLRTSVEPSPARAKVLADPYCDKRQRLGLLTVCAFGAAPDDAAHTFALVGDSHAANLKTALAAVTLARHWRGISILRSGCPATRAAPILQTAAGSRRCQEWNGQLRTWLAEHREVGTIFLTAHSGARVTPTAGRRVTESVRAGYRDEISLMLKLGKRVVVIRDPPSSTGGQLGCVAAAIRARRSAARTCTSPRTGALKPDDLVIAARYLRSARVKIIDLTRHFCDATRCFAVIGGVLVRHDATHLTQTFAATLGPFVVRALDG